MLKRFFKDTNKKDILAWSLFDFANSSYTLLILSFVFPIYFREVIAGGSAMADFWWGLAVSISILIGGILSPIIGAIADYDTRKKQKFILFSCLAIIGTAALYFVGSNMLVFGLFLFIITNVCFEIAQTLYDSFLLHVSTEETSGRISGLGWGLGYLGGVISLLLLRPLYENGYAGGLESLYKLTFPLTALFFFLFALPSFIVLKENRQGKEKESIFKLIKIGFSNVKRTLKEIKSHKKIAWFLLGFYLLNDALVTIFTFLPIYARTTIGMSFQEIIIIMLIVQLIGFPATVFFGWLSDKKDPRKILLFTIFVWALITLGMAISPSKVGFYIAAIPAGFVIGSSQAVARSWFSKLIPKEKASEFFGFNGFASKVAATTGPLLFGIVSMVTASQRMAILTILPYFVISFFIFFKLKDKKMIKEY